MTNRKRSDDKGDDCETCGHPDYHHWLLGDPGEDDGCEVRGCNCQSFKAKP